MSNFRLKDVPRWFLIKSQNCYLIMLWYRRKTYFTAICTLLKNPRHFRTKYSIFCLMAKKKFTSENQSTNQVPHLCIFYSRRLFLMTQDTNAEHILIQNLT
jgi:hypothetical protein